MRGDEAGGERLSLPERRRPLEQALRHEREDLADEAEVGERVHAHEQEVVALREHVLVHLLRPLRGDEQVEPELAALARDPDGVLGRDRGQRIFRARRADVVRLVDHDQDGPALFAPPPELAQDGRGGQACSSLVASEPRSTTRQRTSSRASSARATRGRPPAQTPQRCRPRLRARASSCRPASRLARAARAARATGPRRPR